MIGTGSANPWSDFWASGGAAGGRCLPQGPPGIEAVLRELWGGAARALGRRARVLDLASGDGTVLASIQTVRQDLELIGIDSASRLPPAPSGVTLRAGIAMEQMPFPDSHFDLVTSQFGIEYGDTSTAAFEVRRVLGADGRLLFVLHHRQSTIVAHNLQRREALRWAAGSSDYLGKARSLANARGTVPFLPTPDHFRSAPREARRRFPAQPVAVEFVTAILQTLEGSRQRPPAEALAALDTLEQRAANEIARLDQLEAASCDESRIEAIAEDLAAADLDVAPPELLRERGNGAVFAWLLRTA